MRPLITEATGPQTVAVTLGPDSARQLAHRLAHRVGRPWLATAYTGALTNAEIHLSGDDVDAFADSTADAHDIAAQPDLPDDRHDAVADGWRDNA